MTANVIDPAPSLRLKAKLQNDSAAQSSSLSSS